MITCPACGKDNEDSAFECRRCRAPLRDEAPPEEATEPPPAAAPEHHAAPAHEEASSSAFGTVCPRCEAYNEPGVERCTSCGYKLFAEALAAATAEPEPATDRTPPDGSPAVNDELAALALSDEEAAEAMGSSQNGHADEPAMDKTPPQPFAAHEPEPDAPTPPPSLKRVPPPGAAVSAAPAAAAKVEPPPPPPPPAAPKIEAAPAASEKTCASCGASNPPAAKFCFDCGTPFVKKAAPPPPEPPKPLPRPEPVAASTVHVEGLDDEMTAEAPPVAADEPIAAAEPEPEPAAEVAQPIEEPPPPFQASLVVEKGAAPGTQFMLARLENRVGADGGDVQISEDPYIAPVAATVLFAEDHLVLRDEGSANGVYVKVREQAPLEPGDCFVAGERLLRYEGFVELPKAEAQGDTPLLGAPRAQGTVARIVEVLTGGKTGRTCHRVGPTIAIGRTGCDLNFPADSLLGAKHAEIHLGEDGSATLVDLAAGEAGVWLRVRQQATFDLQAGDLVQIGDQQLRVEVG